MLAGLLVVFILIVLDTALDIRGVSFVCNCLFYACYLVIVSACLFCTLWCAWSCGGDVLCITWLIDFVAVIGFGWLVWVWIVSLVWVYCLVGAFRGALFCWDVGRFFGLL